MTGGGGKAEVVFNIFRHILSTGKPYRTKSLQLKLKKLQFTLHIEHKVDTHRHTHTHNYTTNKTLTHG